MHGLTQIPVTEQTMAEKDEALKPGDMVMGPAGGKYAGKNRQWQGIPSLTRTENGRLYVCFYSGGDEEGAENYVLLKKSDDEGRTWSEPILAVDPAGNVRAFDPCLWTAPDGRVFLFWAQSYGGFDGRAGCWFSVCEAPDVKNPEWSGPIRIGDGVMLNKPTVLQNGDWLLPISLWKAVTSEYNPSCPNRLANVYRSSDGGKSFHYLSGVDMPDRYYDEHMLVERTDGSLWMLLRLQTGLGEAFSADGGKTWHSIEKSGIWGPNARFFIRRLRSGRLLLVNHARESGEDTSGADASGAISKANISGTDMVAGKRNRLAAFLSDDEGKTWSRPLILDEREDVSYPDGVEREDGLIELIYDYSRFAQKEILMAKFREEDILAGRMVSADGKLRILVDKAGE